MIRKHRHEEEVSRAMKLPRNGQLHVFSNLKKRAIHEHNLKEVGKIDPSFRYEREHGCDVERVCCSNCKGLYKKSSYTRHRKICGTNSGIPPQAFPLRLLSKSFCYKDFLFVLINQLIVHEVLHWFKSFSFILLCCA